VIVARLTFGSTREGGTQDVIENVTATRTDLMIIQKYRTLQARLEHIA